MDLILVNKYSPLPEDYKAEDLIALKDIPDRCFDLSDDSFLLNMSAAEALNSFLMEAASEGYKGFKITDAYRTREYQEEIYRTISDGMAAKPGQSEHETGLAVDISVHDVRMDLTRSGDTKVIPTSDWLADHCQDYGFILRYPEYKEDLTGVRYEPWHFRYVGIDVAQYIKAHNLCLEEYFEQEFGIPIVKSDLTKELRTREMLVWNFLMSKIQNPYGAAALMGNLRVESELKSEVLQFDYHKKLGYDSAGYTKAVDNGDYKNFENDGAGYGIAQWSENVRKEGLLKYARGCNKSIGDVEMQLEYLWHELCTDYIDVKNALVEANSIREASDMVVDKLLKIIDPTIDVYVKRADFGKRFYDTYVDKCKK